MIRLIFWTLLANALMAGARLCLRLSARCMVIADALSKWCRRAEKEVDAGLKREAKKKT